MKFDGKLEMSNTSDLTEMDKEQLFQGVQENINYYGLQVYKTKDWPSLATIKDSPLQRNLSNVSIDKSNDASQKKKGRHQWGSEDYLRNRCPLLGGNRASRNSSALTASNNDSAVTSSSTSNASNNVVSSSSGSDST